MVKSILVANALTLSSANGYHLKEVKNLGYSTKYSISDILQKHGAKIGNVLFKNKSFSITILIVGSTLSDMMTKRSNLFKYLTINPYNTDDKIDFEFTLYNDSIVTLSGVIKDVSDDMNNEMYNACYVNFVVETEYPFLLSKQAYQQTINIAIGGGAEVPMSIPLDFTSGAAISTLVQNGGNVFAYPVFRFYGGSAGLTNPVLTDTDNDVSMSINMTIAAGDYLILDTYEKTVIDQDGNNQLDKLLDNFLILNVGDNNLKLLSDDAGDDGYVEVEWQYHYVSV